MFKTLFIKEIHETLNNNRSIVSALLCLLIIPLGMYINTKDYESRRNTYKESEKLYDNQSKGHFGNSFNAHGFRPPSPFGVFARGMEDALPDEVNTNSNGIYTFSKNNQQNDALSELFGPMDFLYIVGFILSILAVIFTFNTISGERESGTLKLVISNPVPRWKYIIAKITGSYTVFFVSFLLSFIAGLLVIMLTRILSMQGLFFWLTVFAILLITSVFLLVMFSLGTLASCLTKNSVSSVIIVLFAWVILFSFIPKASPLIARLIYPVNSQKAVDDEKYLARRNLETELDAIRKEILEKHMRNNQVNPDDVKMQDQTPEQKRSFEAYDNEIVPVETEYQQKIFSAIDKIDNDHENKLKKQQTIARNISRISPVSCYMYLLTEVTLTGLLEWENFKKYGGVFQNKVEQEIYSKYKTNHYIFGSGNKWIIGGNKEGVDASNLSVPHLDGYKSMNLGKILVRSYPDLLLLLFYLIAIPWITFVVFLRYDVR